MTAVLDDGELDALVTEIRRHATGHNQPLRIVDGYLARASMAALVADDAGCYVSTNLEACKLTGFSREELLRLTVADLTAPADAANVDRLWNSFVRSDHQRGTYSLRRKDGSVVEVRYDAYTNLATGVHISFLTPVDGAGGDGSR